MARASPARILVVDDEEMIRWSLERDLSRQGYEVKSAATAAGALESFSAQPVEVVLLDINLPDGRGPALIPRFLELREDVVIIMITSDTTLESAVECVREGAWDYLTKPFDFHRLYATLARSLERTTLRRENRALKVQGAQLHAEVVGHSAGMRQALELASRVAASDPATVLLLGESGVGKDFLARFIHRQSERRERVFMDINCATLSEALLESELFGHEKGAFTDARVAKAGLFELAEGGTVFLDEFADAPLLVQAKLLKVLEQRTFRRVGGGRDLTADVRVIAATNRNLEEALAHKMLREDLYYRLKVFPIVVPPLRTRPEDVLPLARHFLQSYARSFRKRLTSFSPEVEALLAAYAWPGNVRELRNLVERAAILARDETAVGLDLLPEELSAVGSKGGGSPDDGDRGLLAQAEARLIREVLAANDGNQSKAAAQLGIGRMALARRLKRLGLTSPASE